MKTPKIVLFRDATGEWRWHLKAANGRIIADSAEGYKTRNGCELAADRLAHAWRTATWKVIE